MEIPQAEPLRMECEHFLHCMVSGQRPSTDGAEGLRVLRILNAAQNSLDQNGKRMELDEGVTPEGRGFSFPSDQAENYNRVQPRTSIPKEKAFFVHETAVVDESCEIGKGTKIWHFSHVLSNSKIGENCNIGQNVVIGPDVTIGDGCKIQNNVSVYKGVTLEDGVFCGPSMVFTNIYNPRAEIRKMDQIRSTLVKHGATLGANCTIVCGTTIDRYAFVGAGAVVTQDVPDHALVLGNPARQVGWICQCGERLAKDLKCLVCGKTYIKAEDGLEDIFGKDKHD